MKTLVQYIAEAKKDFGKIDKQFYVIKDPYYNYWVNIITQEDITNYISGANGVDSDWDIYEDFSPKDILYATDDVKDAVNWVLKYKKIDPEKFLQELNKGNEDCKDPDDYEEETRITRENKLHDLARFYWAVLTDRWKNEDIF